MNRILRLFLVLFTSTIVISPVLNLVDSLFLDSENRMNVLSSLYLLTLILSILFIKKISKLFVINMTGFDKTILVFYSIINLIISIRLFTDSYLTQTLDFDVHVQLVELIKDFQQPFLGTRNSIHNSSPFYPQGGLYQFAAISYITDLNSNEVLKYAYIIISSTVWPIILWSYIQTFGINQKIRTKIWIIGLSFNHFPYGYLFWGHTPTVLSILLAFILDILGSKLKSDKYRYFSALFLSLILTLLVHPVGFGTLLILLLIRRIFQNMQLDELKIFHGKNNLQKIIVISTLALAGILFSFYPTVKYQITQNIEKLLEGTLFEYNTSILERFINFFYEWNINMKYINWPFLDLLFWGILILTIILYRQRRYLVVLLSQTILVMSTAASQQPFPVSLIALPTFPFYSSPSRITHITIIIYVLTIGNLLFLKSKKIKLVEIATSRFSLLMFLAIFNFIFYTEL